MIMQDNNSIICRICVNHLIDKCENCNDYLNFQKPLCDLDDIMFPADTIPYITPKMRDEINEILHR